MQGSRLPYVSTIPCKILASSGGTERGNDTAKIESGTGAAVCDEKETTAPKATADNKAVDNKAKN